LRCGVLNQTLRIKEKSEKCRSLHFSLSPNSFSYCSCLYLSGQLCYPKIFNTAVIHHSSTALFFVPSFFSFHLFCGQLCCPKIFNTAVIHHSSTTLFFSLFLSSLFTCYCWFVQLPSTKTHSPATLVKGLVSPVVASRMKAAW